jgi:hypothetical protein
MHPEAVTSRGFTTLEQYARSAMSSDFENLNSIISTCAFMHAIKVCCLFPAFRGGSIAHLPRILSSACCAMPGERQQDRF